VAGFTVPEGGGQPEIVFSNGGPGLAVGLCYLTVIGAETFGGYVGTGLLQSGAEWRERLVGVLTSSKGEAPPLVWTCRDVDDNAHVRAYHGGYRRFDRKLVVDPNREGFTLADSFRRMYPDVSLPTRHVGMS